MTLYVARLLDLSLEEALLLRRDYARRFGTTLGGLLAEQRLSDPEDFLEQVHPQNISDYLSPNPELASLLASLSWPKSIFTNSPLEYAKRVLECLGLSRFFENIFDIRFCKLQGKPQPLSYQLVLSYLRLRPSEVLLIDDVEAYLMPFAAMGGKVVLLDETESISTAYPKVKNLAELKGLVKIL